MTPIASNARTSVGIALRVAALLAVFAGCQQVDDALDEREAVLEGRQAIDAYTAEMKGLWDKQQRWVSGIVKGARQTTPEAITQQWTPALGHLDTYIEALDAIEPATKPLSERHDALVAAHRAVRSAFATFSEGLTRENYTTRRAALGAEISTFHAAQTRYVEGIEAYYGKHGVERLPDPPLRLDNRPR